MNCFTHLVRSGTRLGPLAREVALETNLKQVEVIPGCSHAAEAAEPLRSLIRPEDARFGKPGRMPGKITDYCRETGQPIPDSPGAFIRCVLESLALLYGQTLAECAAVTQRSFRVLHVVGGGSRNRLLNRFTADAVGLPVVAGPVEATAIGNLLIQAKTLGHEAGDIRSVVRRSFPVETFAPAETGPWRGAAKRFEALPVGGSV